MKTSSHALLKPLPTMDVASQSDKLSDDPRWRLASAVAAGPHFVRSALLSKFLLYVVAETLEGRQHAISEHKIGVTVFGRPPHYRTDEDNIVRNYARQLRRRLADHFATLGKDAPMRIEMPVGGYIPSFPSAPAQPRLSIAETQFAGENVSKDIGAAEAVEVRDAIPGARWLSGRMLRRMLLTLIALGAVWAIAYRYFGEPRMRDPMRILWHNVLPGSRTAYVVPADAGFNLIEDLSGRSIPLDDYINRVYETMSTGGVDRHATQDLHNEQYTDFASMQAMSMVARRPEFDPQRVRALFPRELRLSDLKTANALIIGSSSSNPWASLVDADTNFGIETRPDMEGAKIVNRHPAAGERPAYISNWNEPAHETFALILYRPNLSGSGNVLLIEGLDEAGTQGATEALFESELAAPILKRAVQPDGTLRAFEILLRTTSIHSSAEGTQVIASRIP